MPPRVDHHLHGYITHVNYKTDEETGLQTLEQHNAVVLSSRGPLKLYPEDVVNKMFIEKHRHVRFIFDFDKWSNPRASECFIGELVNPGDSKLLVTQERSAMVEREVKVFYQREFKDLAPTNQVARERCVQ